MERNLYLIEDGDERWFVAAESYEMALALWRKDTLAGMHPEAEPDEMALIAESEDVLVQEETP